MVLMLLRLHLKGEDSVEHIELPAKLLEFDL